MASTLKRPNFKAIEEFIKFIPEGNDIIRNTVASILHRNFQIERYEDEYMDKPSKETLKKEYRKIKDFVENPDNFKAHEATLMAYLTYSFASMEVTNTALYPFSTIDTHLTYDEKLYKSKGIIKTTGIQVSTNGRKRDLNHKQAFVYTYSSANNNEYGDSRFSYNQVFFDLLKKAFQKNIALLENSFQSNLYITYQQGVTRKDMLSNAKLLSAMYAGHEKSGSPLHMPPAAELNQLDPDKSMQDISYIRLIEIGRDVLRTAFNYPSPQNSSVSTTSPNDKRFIVGTVNPEKKRYESFINDKIVRKILGIENFRLKLPEMKVGSSLEIAQYGEIALKRGIITANELREELDFNTLDSRKEQYAFADKFYIQTDRWVVDRENNTTVLQENSKDATDNSELTTPNETNETDGDTQQTDPQSNLENNPTPN